VSDATRMDVFLIPVGPERYEPYCEVADESAAGLGEAPASRGWWGRLHERFRSMMAAAERERQRPAADHDAAAGTWAGRVRRRTLRWMAEKVAEQRLLWHLRRQDAATLVFPSDMSIDAATAALRSCLRRDAERHRRWLVVDAALLLASSLLTVIPGPNVIWWFFAFRVVGHGLSWRGARHGLAGVRWTARPIDDLVALRQALRLRPGERASCVRDVASRLRLQHLARFVERTAAWSA
jgi:hypothetical protein